MIDSVDRIESFSLLMTPCNASDIVLNATVPYYFLIGIIVASSFRSLHLLLCQFDQQLSDTHGIFLVRDWNNMPYDNDTVSGICQSSKLSSVTISFMLIAQHYSDSLNSALHLTYSCGILNSITYILSIIITRYSMRNRDNASCQPVFAIYLVYV